MTREESTPGASLLAPADEQERASLLSQIRWFNQLRLIVAAGVIWLCALATHAFELIRDPWPLYMLGASIVFVDTLYIVGYRVCSAVAYGLCGAMCICRSPSTC